MRRRWWFLALLVVVALVSGGLTAWAVSRPRGEVTDAGTVVPLDVPVYGQPRTVRVPGADVEVTVASPTRSLGVDLAESGAVARESGDDTPIQAATGDRLVPVSWRRSTTGNPTFEEPDATPVTLALALGGRRYDLASITDPLDDGDGSVVVAVDGEVTLDDVAVEVTYDGQTQVLHPATGRIDAGVAQPLYDAEQDYEHDDCELVPPPGQGLAPDETLSCTASRVSLRPYLEGQGWADEGTLWAAVRVQVVGPLLVDTRERLFEVRGGTATLRLDGQLAVGGRLRIGRDGQGSGRLVFAVRDAPRRLDIAVRVTGRTEGGAERTFTARQRLDLTRRETGPRNDP